MSGSIERGIRQPNTVALIGAAVAVVGTLGGVVIGQMTPNLIGVIRELAD
jgi:hypothetical protein